MEFLIPARTARPSDDPIFALNAEAQARTAAGEQVVNATVGALLDDEGRLAVIPTVTQTLREIEPLVGAGYAPISGSPAFLDAVIRDLLGDRPEAKQAVAAATPGGSGALRHAVANFLERGQSLLTTSFYWGPYKTLSDESERQLSTFRMFEEGGRLDAADFERKLRGVLDAQGRALVFLNSPCHNPTGYSFDDDEWRAVTEVVARESERGPIALLLDVAYARYGGATQGDGKGGSSTADALAGCLDRVLPIAGKALLLFAWSASKAFTQYGLRVGALVAVHPDADERSRIQNALSYSCRGTWSNCNAGGMAAIARVLTDPTLAARVEKERAQLKALLDRRVAKWNELATAAKLRYPRYDGGFFTTVFCEDAPAVAARLRAAGVFVVPQAGALRVALCSVPERDVPRLVTAMGTAGACRP
jgi:aromatic-amino-acid transaminase